MARRLLSSILTVVITLGLMTATVFAVGVSRKTQDTTSCQKAVMAGTL